MMVLFHPRQPDKKHPAAAFDSYSVRRVEPGLYGIL
jgi:hypothetical protein